MQITATQLLCRGAQLRHIAINGHNLKLELTPQIDACTFEWPHMDDFAQHHPYYKHEKGGFPVLLITFLAYGAAATNLCPEQANPRETGTIIRCSQQ
jgi:hypothetical protein